MPGLEPRSAVCKVFIFKAPVIGLGDGTKGGLQAHFPHCLAVYLESLSTARHSAKAYTGKDPERFQPGRWPEVWDTCDARKSPGLSPRKSPKLHHEQFLLDITGVSAVSSLRTSSAHSRSIKNIFQ